MKPQLQERCMIQKMIIQFVLEIPQTAETSSYFQNRIPTVNEKLLKIARRPQNSTKNLTEASQGCLAKCLTTASPDNSDTQRQYKTYF